jgi:Acetyltransferase (GNAT) domain
MHNDFEEFSVERYCKARRQEWNSFVNTAKNATFLFLRGYMDYHSARFADYSLMIFHGQKLVALLPANLAADGILISHEGLTYGGLVVSRDAALCQVLACFHAVLRHLSREHIPKLLYKQIPSFYNTLPDDEVNYALFLTEAQLYRRDCATVVVQSDRLECRKGRKSDISRARRVGVRVVRETAFQAFWEHLIVPQLALRYGVQPVHTLDEITLLGSRFPENIKQFSAYYGDEIVAGTTIFETPTVAHSQYAAVSDHGRRLGAQAFLFGWLMDEYYKDKRFFDFGISNEFNGRAINHGLLDWKEGFGGRSYMHDFYDVCPGNYVKLEPVLSTRLLNVARPLIPAAPMRLAAP